MDCSCAVTMKKIIEKTNKTRAKKGKGTFSYQQAIMLWKKMLNDYEGKRNPYKAHGKIGVSYVFTSFTANKIVKKLNQTDYNFMPHFDPWKNYYKAA